MTLKEICLGCICIEEFEVQIMTLCSWSLQYRHRLYCIQWNFLATDNDSQRWDWATERFIEFSSVTETETHWVIVKDDAEMIITEPHMHIT